MDLAKHCLVKPHSRLKLKDRDPADTFGVSKDLKKLEKNLERLRELQHLLYADKRHSLLIVLQALDAGGKDGTIRHVMDAFNPQGCNVVGFKAPTPQELRHDYLWRVHPHAPGKGSVAIFNRSHYEDVLIVRVHDLVPKTVWSRRYARINAWERRLVKQDCTVVKVFLHLSKAEQKARLLERIADPSKHWKVGPDDISERHRWDDYQAAYDAVLAKCCTNTAPWYVVPADRKWYRDWALSHLLLETLRGLDLGWPQPTGLDLIGMRAELLAEA